MEERYLFPQEVKLNFIATNEGFLVFKDGDILSGLKINTQFLTIVIETISGKNVVIANLNLSSNSSLVVFGAKAMSVSPSNESAVVYIEFYSKDDIQT
ncbi:MAG: hypothetical protein N3F64_02990 [Nitrososphaeria archaeon]|nr:hypothetical protein [Nitrososphaeria archaeon]